LSDTIREGKNSGRYRFHDIRPEIEYGITDSLTVSVEGLIFDHDYRLNDCIGPMYETQGGSCEEVDGEEVLLERGAGFDDTQWGGYEVALKYNVLSPYKDVIGLSLGLGYERRDKYRLDGADIDQDSVTTTLFLQKEFMDDTLVLVLNTKVEFERRKSPGVLEEEIALDVAAGISYRIAPQWFVGFEYRHQSDYLNPQEDGEFDPTLDRSSFDLSDFRVGSQHQNGNYVGPTVHFAEKKWWATVGVLWQVSGGGSPHAYVNSGRNWDEHEKMHIGLIYGYEF
jgi:opacity protein-like surface antigen